MMDKLKAMTVFVKTVEHGSFRAAATELDLSPSVISYHIQALEKKLGVALLYRTTRKLSLSPEGNTLFKAGQSMLSDMLAAFDLLTDETETPTGKLSISLPSALIGSQLSEAIAQFSLKFPKITLCLSNSDKAKDMISSGFDVLIRVGGSGSDEGKRKNLFLLERSLVASPDHLLKNGTPNTIAQLKQSQWIGLSQLPNTKIMINNKGREYQIEFSPYIQTDSVQDMAVLCRNGLGISTPPTFMVEEDIKHNRLSVVMKTHTVQPLMVYAQWPNSRFNSKLTQRFLEFISNHTQRISLNVC